MRSQYTKKISFRKSAGGHDLPEEIAGTDPPVHLRIGGGREIENRRDFHKDIDPRAGHIIGESPDHPDPDPVVDIKGLLESV